MDSMQTQRNRRSPRVPNQPWRGPGNLTIAQTVALIGAVLFALALWWASGLAPGAGSFWGLAARMIGTGFLGGIAALLFYAMADPNREPFIRQHVTYTFRRHVYRTSKEHAHGPVSRPLPFPRRASVPGVAVPARAPGPTRARVAVARVTAHIRAGLSHRGPHPSRRDTPPREGSDAAPTAPA